MVAALHSRKGGRLWGAACIASAFVLPMVASSTGLATKTGGFPFDPHNPPKVWVRVSGTVDSGRTVARATVAQSLVGTHLSTVNFPIPATRTVLLRRDDDISITVSPRPQYMEVFLATRSSALAPRRREDVVGTCTVKPITDLFSQCLAGRLDGSTWRWTVALRSRTSRTGYLQFYLRWVGSARRGPPNVFLLHADLAFRSRSG